ncbi:hypothetical protein OG470_10370 [Micromonospora sp. NBC_00389]|uniref:hypothetical protein n=1 Tax=Micromonospora sp. NBC_00389 TaxID=2903586 RepID=UPI002E1C8C31
MTRPVLLPGIGGRSAAATVGWYAVLFASWTVSDSYLPPPEPSPFFTLSPAYFLIPACSS